GLGRVGRPVESDRPAQPVIDRYPVCGADRLFRGGRRRNRQPSGWLLDVRAAGPQRAEALVGRVRTQRTVGAKRDWRGAGLMVRLYFYVEGQTEQEYAARVLRPHLARFGVQVMGAVRAASGRKHGRVSRGGGSRYQPMRNDLGHLLRPDAHADARFTTMFDL